MATRVDQPEEGGGGAQSTIRKWLIVLILLVLFLVAVTDRQIIAIFAVAIQHDLGLSDVQLGLLQGFAFSIIYGTAGFGMAWLADRYSRRLVLFWGIVIWSISCSLAGFANSFSSLFLARLGVGFGEGGLTPGAHSVIRSLFKPEKLAAPIAVYSMGGNLGTGLSFAIGAALINYFQQDGNLFAPLLVDYEPWQVALMVVGLPGLLVAGLTFIIPRNAPEANREKNGSAPRGMTLSAFAASHRLLLGCHLAGFTLMIMNTYSLLAWTPAYLERSMSLAPSALGGWFFVGFGLMPAIGGLFFGLLVDWMFGRGNRSIHFLCMIAVALTEAALMVAAFNVHDLQHFVLLLSARGFVSGATLICGGASLQMLSPPNLSARMSAIYLFAISGIGGGLGPLMVGFVTEHLLGDHAMVGTSIMMVGASAALSAAVLFGIGLGPLRATLEASLKLQMPSNRVAQQKSGQD